MAKICKKCQCYQCEKNEFCLKCQMCHFESEFVDETESDCINRDVEQKGE